MTSGNDQLQILNCKFSIFNSALSRFSRPGKRVFTRDWVRTVRAQRAAGCSPFHPAVRFYTD